MSRILTDDLFEKEILQAEGVSLVDLWADWCGPCKTLGPTIDQIADEYKDSVRVYKLDVDSNPRTPTQFHVRGIPTVLFFKDGKLVDQLVGAHPKETLVQTLSKIQGVRNV